MSLTINHNLMALNTSRNLSSHYGNLATSTRRLSSGLRVGTAADDAAGLAVRELMRADIASMGQGVRNMNDAISMIQVADSALQVIDEKLIRMKELATQAATGTYTSAQRAIIDAEFQQMALEINRISEATEFNGIKLLNGNLSASEHNGSGLAATGKLKVHFGKGNRILEDYYHVQIGGASIGELGLTQDICLQSNSAAVPIVSDKLVNNGDYETFSSGIIPFFIIPSGTTNFYVTIDDLGENDTIQIFTTSGQHIIGTLAGLSNDWTKAGINNVDDVNSKVLTSKNGFDDNASYDGSMLNGRGHNLIFRSNTYYVINYNGMSFGYTGDGNSIDHHDERSTIREVKEDLVLLIVGAGSFRIKASWKDMPDSVGGTEVIDVTTVPISISTQELAQQALDRINAAIVTKDNVRAYLGAMQNRLENTATNLQIQAENLQSAESRISDIDVALEMTNLVKNQILAQGATAMLAQANTLPQMALELIQG